MWLVGVAWGYVVVMMAAAEASSSTGTVLGAFITLLLYGALPLAIVMYLLGTGARRRKRLAAEAESRAAAEAAGAAEAAEAAEAPSTQPDGGSHATGDTVAPIRKES